MVYPTGLVALTMRQTNIFWVAIFLGGLEAVKTVSGNRGQKNEQPPPAPWKERAKYELERWGNGDIHDIPLSIAGFHGTSSSFFRIQSLTEQTLHSALSA